MKKILTTMYIGLVCCIISFDANCADYPVDNTDREKVAGILCAREIVSNLDEAFDLVALMSEAEIHNYIINTETTDSDYAQREQDKVNAELMAQLRIQAAQEQMSQETIRQMEAEENLERRRLHEEEEAATAAFLKGDPEVMEQMRQERQPYIRERVAAAPAGVRGERTVLGAGITGPTRVYLMEYLEALDKKHHRGFVQMFNSGEIVSLCSALAEYNPEVETNAGNALNIILNNP